MSENDIICAVATPPGRSALAIVRVSGLGSIELVSNCLPALSNAGPGDSRKIIHGFILDSHGAPVDEVTAIPYFPPKSYTAEEMVEIICHGGFISNRSIVGLLIENGARLAEPGEFTKRAFLNGRISLSEAESVVAAIDAKSELALKAAAKNLKGELYHRIDDIRRHIEDLLTLIEAEIDFSDDEITKISAETMRVNIREQIEKSRDILKSYDFGQHLNSGYKVVIAGKPNVGKSSLLNALLRRDRAIVTDIPGTTRDTLTEWIELYGFPILLTDTAGLREHNDRIEKLGQQRTQDEIGDADLILVVVDGSTGIDRDDIAIMNNLKDKRSIVVINKIDLGNPAESDSPNLPQFPDIVPVSALRGDGLDDLRGKIASCLSLEQFDLDTTLLATQRQFQAMTMAAESLAEALGAIERQATPEIMSLYLRETLDHLGELVGETASEDILNNIFGRFCIGK